MGITLVILYSIALGFIMVYSMVQVHLSVLYLKSRRKARLNPPVENADREGEWPMVTVQLPIYNEMYVIERLIDAVVEFDYPRDRFEIQVLDDSNDETVEIVAAKVAALKAEGLQIEHVRRPERVGFKAGALQYGMGIAKGEFIAIFDADFVPHSYFLKKTIPHFSDPEIGVVQTRWEHINEGYSMLTKLQAFALDAHFSVEQRGRNEGGHFINFNGTAGIWRRTTIDDAGGWQADTLTEDLDLSYRAQLKGWRFKFLERLGSPAELPAAMSAIKSQQFRWTKGAAETAKKNLGKVIKAKLPLGTKVHATFHLLNSFLFICILMSGLMSVPIVFFKAGNEWLQDIFQIGSIFILSLVALISFFWISRSQYEEGPLATRFSKFILTFPLFLSISMGLSLHNAIATMEGYLGIKSPFIRTPKYNIQASSDNWRTRTEYLTKSLTPLTILEGILALYFLGGIFMDIYFLDFGMVPFHVMLTAGYGAVCYFSIRHSLVSA